MGRKKNFMKKIQVKRCEKKSIESYQVGHGGILGKKSKQESLKLMEKKY